MALILLNISALNSKIIWGSKMLVRQERQLPSQLYLSLFNFEYLDLAWSLDLQTFRANFIKTIETIISYNLSGCLLCVLQLFLWSEILAATLTRVSIITLMGDQTLCIIAVSKTLLLKRDSHKAKIFRFITHIPQFFLILTHVCSSHTR